MKAFPGTDGRHRTPTALGFMLLGVNLALMGGWALSMVASLFLGRAGMNVPPWLIALLFMVLTMILWVWFCASLPRHFTHVDRLVCVTVGLLPVVAATAAEYAYLAVDPEGCAGAHLMLLMLGTAALCGFGLAFGVGRVVARVTSV